MGYHRLRLLSKLFPKDEKWIKQTENYLQKNNLDKEYELFLRIKGKEIPRLNQQTNRHLT